MLHELLFVLLGYPGDVFVPSPPTGSTTFAIPHNFPLLHPTERECLNRLGQLGWTYLQIHQFIASVKDLKLPTTPRHGSQPHGAYIQALVTCIERTLNEYRADILAMEQRILSRDDDAGSDIVPLALITANLSRWELLLPALHRFVQLLQRHPAKYHGCRLFDLLMDQSRTGVLEFRAEIEKMMAQLHNVLYRQLTAWMVYGQWVDPDSEFFIVPYSADDRPSTATAWNRLYVIDYSRIPSHLSHALAESILFVGKAIATVNEMDKLPMSIARHDSDSLLPFASSRRSFQHLQQMHKIRIPLDMKKRHLQLLLSLHSSSTHCASSPWIRYPQQLQAIVSQVRKSTAEWLFTQVLIGDHGLHRYLASFRHVFLLKYGDLASNFIDECALWRRKSLQKGGVGSDKAASASATAKPPSHPSKTAVIFRYQELNALLSKASIGTDAEDQLQGYKLLLQEDQTRQYPFADLLLVDLRMVLTFDLEWPIDLFLSKSDLKNYSHLWSFLISLKNTQMSLNNLYKLLRCHQDDAGAISKTSSEYYERVVWRTRAAMLFWVDTVWNHVQSQVIDVHYQQLISSTSTCSDSSTTTTATATATATTPSSAMPAKKKTWQPKAKLDFEEIQAAHQHFLHNTMRGCLLVSSDCIATMHHILKTCLLFCDLMERISQDGQWRTNKRRKTTAKTAAEIVNQWTKPTTAVSWMEDVVSLQEKFNEYTDAFFVLASSLPPDVKASGQLDVLLMQLDYNKWFSNNTTSVKDKQQTENSLSEAEKFLESLNLPDAQTQEIDEQETKTDPNDIMSFLDEISNYPTEDDAATDTNKKDTKPAETAPSVTNTTTTTAAAVAEQPPAQEQQKPQAQAQEQEGGWKSWGNSFWSQASAAVKTTTEQINRSVASDSATKLLESRVKTLQNLVNKENIEKLGTGLKNLTTTLLETVAPPISEHELVEVWLAYDMVGYTGLEALVYRAFARVMEHTESGQVVVRNPNSDDTANKDDMDPAHRDLNMCDSAIDGTKLAKANIDHLIKQHFVPDEKNKQGETYNPQSGAVPVIHCPVFMAIQPVKMTMAPIDEEDTEQHQLGFIILMVDPTHHLKFKTYSQSLPLSWLDIPYEENEWVEDKMVDIIRMSVTSIAQDYVWTRMSGNATTTTTTTTTAPAAPTAVDSDQVQEV
ncbi:hypothetical protein MBANPS3_002634 [Mucor bainieri]